MNDLTQNKQDIEEPDKHVEYLSVYQAMDHTIRFRGILRDELQHLRKWRSHKPQIHRIEILRSYEEAILKNIVYETYQVYRLFMRKTHKLKRRYENQGFKYFHD